MWGVNPADRYKTMCPYFWQYVLSILILPAILLYKIGQFILKPFKYLWESYTDRQAALATKELLADIKSAKTDEDYYKIYKSKCFEGHKYELLDLEEDFDTDIFDEIYERYLAFKTGKKERARIKKDKAQAQIDNFKYGTGGKVLSYIIGLGVLVGLGFFIYWFVHLFTWSQFVNFMTFLGIVVVCCVILMGLIGLVRYINKSIPCDNKVKTFFNNIVFWKYIGLFFVMIWKGIRIIIDMIVNVYKQNCPVIHWD